ncbi:MAG: S8 family serine peptidase [Phycisphaerae bacterium]|nr:S8 family serine peptidase [Phycisphaerae bacterium]
MAQKKPQKEAASPQNEGGPIPVLVEIRVKMGSDAGFALDTAGKLGVDSFQLDSTFEPMPIKPTAEQLGNLAAAGEEVVIVRGVVEEDDMEELKAQPDVVDVWLDAPIAPFPDESMVPEPGVAMVPTEEFGTCPIPPCDCVSSIAKGTIADVANYLGVNQIWSRGHRGNGIVIGIVDGGITAQGRPIKPGETAKIDHVTDGWPTDWGTTASLWGDHGNMTATDALGMAPDAHIYDIRISGSGGSTAAISRALSGYQWAINRHKADGTPHILSNSWGIYKKSWASDYATNPNHPFTRKVEEALDEGILVLFAAGNCGQTCPSWKCGSDTGPGKSIWGANGHPRVMTVGAVNKDEQLIGYSSQGPASLDPKKPDFCGISHFNGYFPSDTGTSAACPIVAGVVALMKQGKSSLTQNQAKGALKKTAKDIGPAGWDQHSGYGIIRAKAAYDHVTRVIKWKWADAPKRKIFDDIKLKFRDDGAKHKFFDDVKYKFQDDVKHKFQDDVKHKFYDDVKSPGRDIGGMPPRPGQPRGGMAPATPFILATPHHSMAWCTCAGTGYGAGYGAGMGQYEGMIADYEAALMQMEEVIQQLAGQLEDTDKQYQQMLQEYQELMAEYQQAQASI